MSFVTLDQVVSVNPRAYALDWSRPWISIHANHRSVVVSIGHPNRTYQCSLDSEDGQEILRGVLEFRIPYFRSIDNVMQVTYLFQSPKES